MAFRILPVGTWLLVGLAIGALISQRGDDAPSSNIQMILAAIGVLFVIAASLDFPWERARGQDASTTATPARADLIAQLGISIALMGYAHYLAANNRTLWHIALMLVGAAMLMFVQIARQLMPASADPNFTPSQWLARARQWLGANPIRSALIGLAMLAGIYGAYAAAQVPHPEPFTLSIALWLASMIAFATAFAPGEHARAWRAPNLRALDTALKPYLPEILLVIGLVALAFAFRAFDLGGIPMNLGGDESEMGLEARRVLDGILTNPFSSGWYSHPTMFFFLQSLALRFFGQTVVGLRMVSALIGTLTILSTYLLVRQLCGRGFALAVSVLLLAYPYHIQFSRIGLNNIADAFWAATVFFLAIRGTMTRQIGYFVAGGLALGLSQYFYHGVRLVPVMLAAYLTFWLIGERRTARAFVIPLIVFSVAALIAALPLVFYYLQFPDMLTERYAQMGIFPSGWLADQVAQTGQNPLLLLATRTIERFTLFNLIPDFSGFYAPETPLLETFSAILFAYGFAYALYRWKERANFLFVLWFVSGVFFGSVLILDEAGSARTLTLTVPVMFFVALGAFKLAETIATLLARPQWRRYIVVAGIILLAFINLKFYFVDYIPRRSYAGPVGWANTEMAKYFLAQPCAFKAYFFGPPYDYLSHATIAFAVPNLNGLDILDPIEDTPDFVDHSLPAIFLFIPAREQEFEWVRQAYPDGKRIDFNQTNGTLLFFAYEVESP